MKIVLLTMWLAVAQAVAPVPRQAPNNATGTSGDIQNKTQDEKNPTDSTPALVNQDQSQAPNRNTDQQGSDNAEHSVAVSKLPPVTVVPAKRDWADWGYWAFSCLLVIVGALQIFLLWSTLGAIREQASQMKKQAAMMEQQTEIAKDAAKAASDNALAARDGAGAAEANAKAAEANASAAREGVEIIISKERARIKVKPNVLVLEAPGTLLPPVNYKVSFYGPTPAFITEARAESYVSDSLAASDTSFSIPMRLPEVITPQTVIEDQVCFIGPSWKFNETEIERIDAGTLFVHFAGFIKYSDVFNRERETRFRYYWRTTETKMPDGKKLAYWTKVGPPTDNVET